VTAREDGRMQVAVVDYRSPSASADFTLSLKHTGFAVLTNHPLEADLVQKVYDDWLAFFATDAKFKYPFSPDSQDGYFSSAVSETAKGSDIKDIKEFFHVYPWGKYPTEVTDAALRFYDQATDLAKELLDWVEAETPPEVAARFSVPLSKMLDGSKNTLLRILRYPALTGHELPGAARAAAHEDINLITVSRCATFMALGTTCRVTLAVSPLTLATCCSSRAAAITRQRRTGLRTRQVNPPRARGCRFRCSCTRPTMSCSPKDARRFRSYRSAFASCAARISRIRSEGRCLFGILYAQE
jgi:hypothetical protein